MPPLIQASALSNYSSRLITECPQSGMRYSPFLHQTDTRAFQHLAQSSSNQFSYYCGARLCPMDAVIGSLCAQEVIKGCTGKFTPIHQWFYFDALSCVSHDKVEYTPGNRYAGQSILFGDQVQNRLMSLNTFIVGMGAIGCELLKNFAMMGMSCGPGTTWVIDMERIERSNLNRQFLFRSTDMMRPKSTTAARAIKELNKDMNIQALEYQVGHPTDFYFNDQFYARLDLVLTALDRLDARKFVDLKCVYYRLPMIDSGTHGTRGHCQPVIPHLTESYSSNDPITHDFAFCTVRHFPNSIEHCIQFALDYFRGVFYNQIEAAHKYTLSPPLLCSHPLVLALKDVYPLHASFDWPSCVSWAFRQFHDHFTNNISQLLHNFPPDHVFPTHTSTDHHPRTPLLGSPQTMSFPHHLRCRQCTLLSSSQPTHIQYITLAAHLRAQSLGIVPQSTPVVDILQSLTVPVFTPQEGLEIGEDDQQPVDPGG
ncbi:ubiquitin-like modifier-activating enzyme 1 [Octopus sinensis]|uniref:Ubiquitin-like modifier-activating enzyme 1 n=1 Tax=Octopus sinensis TaxID=2607531 RepID=A0A7E6EL08_9MOLL|nr:ubiquitin-like modifier-activating enzyme 1 [Octopus sinensis]